MAWYFSYPKGAFPVSLECSNLTELTRLSDQLFQQVLIQRKPQATAAVPSPLVVTDLPFQIDIDFSTPV